MTGGETDGETAGERAGVDASGARGVQVGDHNVQVSYFATPSPAVADLQALHPRTAAKRILGLPAEDSAALIAQLTVQHAADVVEELLLRDEPLTVAVLTSMHPARAQELTTRLAAVADWLTDLPQAAAAIRKVHDGARAELGDESGPIVRAGARPMPAFQLACARGVVAWRAITGAVAVTGEIAAYHRPKEWGFPISPERDGVQRFEYADVHIRRRGMPVPVAGAIRQAWWSSGEALGRALTYEQAEGPSPGGWAGSAQDFADPGSFGRAAVYTSSRGGVVALFDPILALYREHGGPTGWLGFPVADSAGPGHGDAVQHFEGGVILRRPQHAALAVPLPIHAAATAARLGAPVGPVQPLGSGDTAQFFEGGLVTLRDGTAEVWLRPPAG
ncbi:hypothetical protein OHA72_55615 [Dactylosporangium sp. NBC_01737]|uniref:hypothetical protein n=1 Tax=Dactylosporangium sp. NBC_01737 TaxID=2975959 RepID=UPI002E15BBF5|nr:hypothetical protein OHA72_55615 [Dactylosporangium sp. NBC_01737]